MVKPASKPKVSSDEENYRKENYPDVSKILKKNVVCTGCNASVKNLITKCTLKCHPYLDTLLCDKCFKFYGDGEFSVDEDGSDKYCRWCGQGGTLYLCGKCTAGFCKKCIKRNLARSALQDVQDDDWECFCCDIKPLYELRALCWAAKQFAKKKGDTDSDDGKSKKRQYSDDTDSEDNKKIKKRKLNNKSGKSNKRSSKSESRYQESDSDSEKSDDSKENKSKKRKSLRQSLRKPIDSDDSEDDKSRRRSSRKNPKMDVSDSEDDKSNKRSHKKTPKKYVSDSDDSEDDKSKKRTPVRKQKMHVRDSDDSDDYKKRQYKKSDSDSEDNKSKNRKSNSRSKKSVDSGKGKGSSRSKSKIQESESEQNSDNSDYVTKDRKRSHESKNKRISKVGSQMSALDKNEQKLLNKTGAKLAIAANDIATLSKKVTTSIENIKKKQSLTNIKSLDKLNAVSTKIITLCEFAEDNFASMKNNFKDFNIAFNKDFLKLKELIKSENTVENGINDKELEMKKEKIDSTPTSDKEEPEEIVDELEESKDEQKDSDISKESNISKDSDISKNDEPEESKDETKEIDTSKEDETKESDDSTIEADKPTVSEAVLLSDDETETVLD